MLGSDHPTLDTHIEITPQLLAALTIERLAVNLNQLYIDPKNWWFTIQDLDLALMAQLIASLSGTTQLGALGIKEQQLMLDHLDDENPLKKPPVDKRGKPLEDKLATFRELLERALDPSFPFINNSQNPLVLSHTQKNDILKLHRFRNSLAHVRPLSWYLERAGLPRMALASTYATEHLFRHSTQRIHMDEAQITKTESNLTEILSAFKAMS